MDIKQELNTIAKKYNLIKKNSTTIQIDVPNIINEFHGMYVVLKCINGNLVLSDNGTICDVLDVQKQQLLPILQKYDITFDNFYLEKKYTNISDIQTFINCLEEISNTKF